MNIRNLFVTALITVPSLSFAQALKIDGNLTKNCINKIQAASAKKLQEQSLSGALREYSADARGAVISRLGTQIVGNRQILVNGEYRTMVGTIFNSNLPHGSPFYFLVSANVDDQCKTISVDPTIAVEPGHY